MRNAFNYLTAAVLLFSAVTLAGCSSEPVSPDPSGSTNPSSTSSIVESNSQRSSDSSLQSNGEPAESDVDIDSIDFDGFRISLDTDRAMSVYTINNQFSGLNGRKVYAVPVTIENTGSETKGINLFYVKAFGAGGNELESVYTYFAEAQDFYKEMRPGAKMQTAYYMLDDGSGEYCIVFKSFTEEKELKINIA